LEDFFNFFEEFFKLLEKMKTVLNPLRKAFRAVKNNKLTILDNYLVEKVPSEAFPRIALRHTFCGGMCPLQVSAIFAPSLALGCLKKRHCGSII